MALETNKILYYSSIYIKNRILGGSYGYTDSLFTWKVAYTQYLPKTVSQYKTYVLP